MLWFCLIVIVILLILVLKYKLVSLALLHYMFEHGLDPEQEELEKSLEYVAYHLLTNPFGKE